MNYKWLFSHNDTSYSNMARIQKSLLIKASNYSMSPSSKLEYQIDLHVTMNNNIKESPNDNEQNNTTYPQDLLCGYPLTSMKLQILNTINF